MHEANHISFQLDGAVPRLERKGGRPHEPEVGFKKMGAKPVVNPGRAQFLLRRDDQLGHRQPVGHIEAHGSDVFDLPLLVDQPRIGVGRMGRVKSDDFLPHGQAGLIKGRDGA
ncbi:hypothetical protein D1872_255170 [compost metagenome]